MAVLLTVSPTSATIVVGGTVQLTATPPGGVKWSCSNCGIARIDKSGLVTGIAVGTATFTAKRGAQTSAASVTVIPNPDPPPPDPLPQPPQPVLTFLSSTGNTTNDFFSVSTAGTRDPDGQIVSFTLDKGDGSPLITGLGLPALTYTFTYALPNTYTLLLTVSDDSGLNQTASMQLIVESPEPPPPPPPPNISPVAALAYVAGTYTTDVHTVSIAGTRDPDGTLVSATLAWGDGVTDPIPLPITVTTLSHVYSAPGTYTRTLTVVDNLGLTATATLTTAVLAPPVPNQPPVAVVALVAAGVTGQPTTITAAGTFDPDGSITSGQVIWGDGATSAYGGPNTYSHIYTLSGVYQVLLQVTDNDGALAQSSVTVTITAAPPPNQPPSPMIVPVSSSVQVNQPAQVNTAGTTDPDGTIISGQVNWGDGSATPYTPATSLYTHTYTTTGPKTVSLTVTDNAGATRTATTSLTITDPPINLPPTARLTLSAGLYAGDLWTLSTLGTADPDGTLAGWTLVFGDGATQNGSGQPPTLIDHTYASPGTPTATLTVTDTAGASAATSLPLTVLTPPPPQTGGTPLSRNEHPRLCMTLADLPAIGASVSSGGAWQSSFQTAVTDIETNYWTSISTSDANSLIYAITMAGLVYNLRKAGVLTGVTFSKTNAEWLAKGVGYIFQLSTNVLTLNTGRQVCPQAWYIWLGYDWLHDGLNATQRQQLFSDHCIVGIGNDSPFNFYDAIVAFKAAAPGTVNGNNPRIWSAETTTRGFSRMITAALALQHDNLTAGGVNSNTWATEQINNWYTPAFDSPADGLVNRESQRGGADGSAIQGYGTYGLGYDMNWVVTMAWAWRTANGLTRAEYYGDSGRAYYRGMARYIFYMMRQKPNGSSNLLLKDLYSNADTHVGEYELQMQFGMLRAELQGVDNVGAALAAWWIANKGLDSPLRWVMSRFLAPAVTAQSPADVSLPLSKAFQPGQWQWRSGWLSTSDTIINVWGYQFTGFNSAVGNFSIDYQGPAIITPGYGGHDLDTSWHGGGTNTLGAPETGRTTLETNEIHGDDFGFQKVYNNTVPNMVVGTVVDWLERTEKFHAIDTTDTYGYLWIDRTRSFTQGGTDPLGNLTKIASAYRQFVAFQPAVVGTDPLILFVFDQMTVVSHSPAFQKRSHTYYSGTPTVTGASASSAGPSRGASGTTGKTTYSGGTPVITNVMTDEGCDNKTWHQPFCFTSAFDVVLVEARRWNPAIGWEFETPYGILNAGSTFTPPPGRSDLQKYIGLYRTEIIPTTPQLTDRFGSVFVVGPTALSAPTIEDWSGTNFTAIRANAKAAALGTAENATTSGTIICKSSGTYQLVIGNLTPGSTRTIAKGANITSVTKINGGGTGPTYVVGSDGVLYVTVVVASSGSAAANTLTVS